MAGNVQTFSCPSCGAPVSLRAQGRSLSVVCASCHAVIDPNDENHRIIQQASEALTREPAIPLGTRGTFEGNLYEIVGFMVRIDQSGEYEWREYLLYNPRQGFCWLLEFDGAWCFTKPIKKPALTGRAIQVYGKSLTPQTPDHPRVTFVLGEFYWKVEVGETVDSVDYVGAPYMISCETSEGETNWSLSTYLSPEDMQKAFAGKNLKLPPKTGKAPNEPGASGLFEGTDADVGNVYAYTFMFSIGLMLFGIMGPATSGSNAFTGFIALIAGAAAWVYFGS